MQIVINGETPAKKNSRINTRSGRSFPSKRYTEWHQSAMKQIFDQTHYNEKFEKPVAVTLHFIHGDKRRRDSDNGTSSIFDTLVDAAVLSDDSWQHIERFSVLNSYEKNNPRCIVTINEV